VLRVAGLSAGCVRMTDVVIVGAGLIGMLTAHELVSAGMQVRVLERGQPARESSWAGGGILSPLYPWRYPDAVSELARWSQRYYPDLCQQCEDTSGIDPQWTRSGLLITDMDSVTQMQQWAARFGVRLEQLDAAGVREREPAFGLQPASAAWLPEVAQIRNPRLVKSLRAMLESRGVEISPDCPAREIDIEAGRVRSIHTPAGAVQADNFIIASGAWSGALLEPTGLDLPVEPVRGQMLLFRGEPGLVSCISLHNGRYVIPRRDGRVLVGSTLEYVGFDRQTTAQARDELHRSAVQLVPALAGLEIEKHWAGLRPGSPDGTPVIGPHPEIANLYINAGHFRNGVVLGPASARILADQLLGRVPVLDIAPYQVENIRNINAS